jgi:hypothetical protein
MRSSSVASGSTGQSRANVSGRFGGEIEHDDRALAEPAATLDVGGCRRERAARRLARAGTKDRLAQQRSAVSMRPDMGSAVHAISSVR